MMKLTEALPHPANKGFVAGDDVQKQHGDNGEFPENEQLHADDAVRAAALQRALRARDRQISLAAEAANMGFWFKDFEQDDFWASEQWRALFGFTSSETLTTEKFLQRLHPNDREPTLKALESAYHGDGSYQSEHRVLLPDGQVRWLACHGRLELNEADRPLRLQGVSLDITRRKLAELEAVAHRNEAAHLLRVASLGELSSALTHELRQPLAAILNNAETAQLLLADEDIDLQQVREILSDIVADDERAGAVISRLHVFVKKREFQPQPLDANELIQEVLQLMHHELMACAVRVVTESTSEALLIRGDRVQLQQVLINLILNAVDSMSQAANNDRTLTLRACRLPGVIRLSVADTGHGIAPGDEETIFESYYTTKPRGLGLGLSLSRSILLAHGGDLRAENQASSGAAFHCTIPVLIEDCAP